MILVLLVLVVAMLLGGLVLSIRSKGWVRLFAVLLLVVALTPVGFVVWWHYWGVEVLLTASPGKTVSIRATRARPCKSRAERGHTRFREAMLSVARAKVV